MPWGILKKLLQFHDFLKANALGNPGNLDFHDSLKANASTKSRQTWHFMKFHEFLKAYAFTESQKLRISWNSMIS